MPGPFRCTECAPDREDRYTPAMLKQHLADEHGIDVAAGVGIVDHGTRD